MMQMHGMHIISKSWPTAILFSQPECCQAILVDKNMELARSPSPVPHRGSRIKLLEKCSVSGLKPLRSESLVRPRFGSRFCSTIISKLEELDRPSSGFPLKTDLIPSSSSSSSSDHHQLVSEPGSENPDKKHTEADPVYHPKIVWFAKSPQEEIQLIDRGINASIAGAAAYFALAKVVTVDQNYWHGWTIFEILRYAPIHNWSAYEDALKNNPVLAKMMISGIVYSLGDWIAQCYEGKPILDFSRSRMIRSGIVGFCLHGSLSHFYYYICEELFPFKEWWVVPLKVLFDQTIWSGIWNSIYFVVLGLLRFESPANIFSELKETFFPLLTAGWKLWPFAHVITYGIIPVEQRLLWVDCVELVWVTILSMYSNQKAEARLLEGSNDTQASSKK